MPAKSLEEMYKKHFGKTPKWRPRTNIACANFAVWENIAGGRLK